MFLPNLLTTHLRYVLDEIACKTKHINIILLNTFPKVHAFQLFPQKDCDVDAKGIRLFNYETVN